MKSFIRWALAVLSSAGRLQPAFPQSRNTGEIRGTVTDTAAPSWQAPPSPSPILIPARQGFRHQQGRHLRHRFDACRKLQHYLHRQGLQEICTRTHHVERRHDNRECLSGSRRDIGNGDGEASPACRCWKRKPAIRGAILEKQTIQNLPQIGAGITGNDWANFNILLPGAAGSPTAPGSEGSGSYNAGDAISINGNLPNYANYLQDGGVVQLPVSNNVDNTLVRSRYLKFRSPLLRSRRSMASAAQYSIRSPRAAPTAFTGQHTNIGRTLF